MIGWEPCSKKRINYLTYIEGKGVGKDIHCSAQNAALFEDLLWNIFCKLLYSKSDCIKDICILCTYIIENRLRFSLENWNKMNLIFEIGDSFVFLSAILYL